MLFPARLRPALADGTVTVAFRRWRRPTVRAGGTLRSPVGVLAIDAVEVVPVAAIDDADARAAGYTSVAELLADLRPPAPGQDPATVHRIAFHLLGQDPRIALREQADLSPAERDELRARLERIDARSRRGPWTEATLRLIADRPGIRAADLAEAAGRETLKFKADVRRLKELGLTESLEVGYRLSPRGQALLRAFGEMRRHAPTARGPECGAPSQE
ncbi:ASCH domain-containing protein [Conexibacter arvalis]|uniref:ASCH domain-containing protein n=1 Tax=Conexibacter arvalis TaxID=912552 RepID=A0A840IGB4_9ACTN|nr:ASCH domain-containing protein [Conexibacter arvalis]MBB4663008.1 hypothetical protein [Conexibacter arvalis]